MTDRAPLESNWATVYVNLSVFALRGDIAPLTRAFPQTVCITVLELKGENYFPAARSSSSARFQMPLPISITS